VFEEEVAEFLGGVLLERYPELLTARFGFATENLDGVGVVEAIAKKRGCLIKGKNGGMDLEKAAMIFLTELRSGKLGRISLETPESRSDMLARHVPISLPE
jgi:ribosome biogenesis GTPase A